MTKILEKEKMSQLMIGALGVIYGDIGTSPLYALKSCFSIGDLPVNQFNVIGIISLFIWCLIIVVFLKYVHLVLKIDHNGEGGILALSSIASSIPKYRSLAIVLGLLGAALFFGDGIITPAISVLSAVEGISAVSPQFTSFIIPLTILILAVLFGAQQLGSGRIGDFFGLIMILWFGTLFLLGIHQIFQNPVILKTLNPYYALNFISNNYVIGFTIMSGVILVVTGVEALYADLGHFGRSSIQLSWTYIVFPALALNYMGQGALLLSNPETISNPFYRMAPDWALHPLIFLATIATVIASQAVISGIFSIAYHSISLSYLPRLKILHTSQSRVGQIYIPAINYCTCALTIGAVLKFGSSEKLAAVYGFCVASIMLITTALIFLIVREKLGWKKIKVFCIFVPLFLLDSIFVTTSWAKFFEGAWFLVAITILVYYCMYVWRKGTNIRDQQKISVNLFMKDYIEEHLKHYPNRMPGTAIYLCKQPFKVPITLVMSLEQHKFLNEKVIFISFISVEEPYKASAGHLQLKVITENVWQITVKSGFMEKPNMNEVFHWLNKKKIIEEHEDILIYLGKGISEKIKLPYLSGLSENLYAFLASMAESAIEFYHIPKSKVIEYETRRDLTSP